MRKREAPVLFARERAGFPSVAQEMGLSLKEVFWARVHGVGQRGGQTAFNQIPWNPVKIRSGLLQNSGPNPLKSCVFRGARCTLWPLEDRTICPFGGFFSCFRVICSIWDQSLWWDKLWSCWFFPCSADILGALGLWNPNSPFVFNCTNGHVYAPKTLHLKDVQLWSEKCPKAREKCQKDKWFHLHAWTGAPWQGLKGKIWLWNQVKSVWHHLCPARFRQHRLLLLR